MPISSFDVQNMMASQIAGFGNQRLYAAQLAQHQSTGAYAAPQVGQNPFMQNVLGVAAMGLQPMGMPGSTQSQMQAQQLGLNVMGLAVSQQTPLLGQIFQNMQQQSAFNQQLQQNFTFARPGGFGFNFQQMQGMNQFVGQQAQQNPMWNQQQMRGVAGMGMQMGMFTGVRDAQQFQQQFRQLIRTAEQVTRVIGGTLEEGVQAIGRMRGMGVFRTADQMRMMQTLPGMAAASGTSIGQLQQFGGQVAQMLRPLGVQGAAGAMAGMRALGTIGTGQQMGVFNEQQLWQATGMGGVEGQQALSGRLMQMSARFTQRTGGKIMMAAFVNPTTGAFDSNAYAKFTSGQLSNSAIESKARANIQEMGGYLSWQQKEGEIRGTFMEGTQGMGQFMLARQAYAKHWDDPRKAQMILRRRFGASREEAPIYANIMQKLPQIMREQEEATRTAASQAQQQAQWEQRSPQMAMARFSQGLREKYLGGITRVLNAFQEGFSGGVLRGIDEMTGRMTFQVSEEGRRQFAQGLSTHAGRGRMRAEQAALSQFAGVRPQDFQREGARWKEESWWSEQSRNIGEWGAGMKLGALSWMMAKSTPYGMPGASGGMQRYGLGGGVITPKANQAQLAVESFRAKGMANPMVVRGPGGDYAVFSGRDVKKRNRAQQLSSGKINFTGGDWGIQQSDYNRIMHTANLEPAITKALKKNDWKGAESAVLRRMEELGMDPARYGHAAAAVVEKVRAEKKLGAPGFELVLGGDPTASAAQRADKFARVLGDMAGVSPDRVASWMTDPEVGRLLGAAATDKNALVELGELASARGDDDLAKFAGAAESNYGNMRQALGGAASAAWGVTSAEYVKKMKGRLTGLMDISRGGLESPLARMLRSMQSKGGALARMLAGEDVSAVDVQEAFMGPMDKALATMNYKQAKEAAGILGEGGSAGVYMAEEMLARARTYRKMKTGKGRWQTQGAAAGRLADMLGMEGASRKKFINQAQKKGAKWKVTEAARLAPGALQSEAEGQAAIRAGATESWGAPSEEAFLGGAAGPDLPLFNISQGARDKITRAEEGRDAFKDLQGAVDFATKQEQEDANKGAGKADATVKLHPESIEALGSAIAKNIKQPEGAPAGEHTAVVGKTIDAVNKVRAQQGFDPLPT